MPHDLPPWGTVWWYFRKWRDDGTWERVEEALRVRVREVAGREATPAALIPIYWNRACPVRLPLPIIPGVNATAHRFGGFGSHAL